MDELGIAILISFLIFGLFTISLTSTWQSAAPQTKEQNFAATLNYIINFLYMQSYEGKTLDDLTQPITKDGVTLQAWMWDIQDGTWCYNVQDALNTLPDFVKDKVGLEYVKQYIQENADRIQQFAMNENTCLYVYTHRGRRAIIDYWSLHKCSEFDADNMPAVCAGCPTCGVLEAKKISQIGIEELNGLQYIGFRPYTNTATVADNIDPTIMSSLKSGEAVDLDGYYSADGGVANTDPIYQYLSTR